MSPFSRLDLEACFGDDGAARGLYSLHAVERYPTGGDVAVCLLIFRRPAFTTYEEYSTDVQ